MTSHARKHARSVPELARTLLRLIRRNTGQHVADSLAGADWSPRTPAPAPAPARISEPRVAPYVLTHADKVRAAYDAVELEFARILDNVVLQSRLNWSMSHA